MSIVVEQDAKPAGERRLDRLENAPSGRAVRLAAGRAVLAAGLVFATAGALMITTTGAQAFSLGDITDAVIGIAEGASKKVDIALRSSVNVGGVNTRLACPHFVGCKVDNRGRIVVDASGHREAKRDVPRDKSIWGRPVGAKTERNIRVRDHQISNGEAAYVIRLRDQRKSSGAAKRIIRGERKR